MSAATQLCPSKSKPQWQVPHVLPGLPREMTLRADHWQDAGALRAAVDGMKQTDGESWSPNRRLMAENRGAANASVFFFGG